MRNSYLNMIVLYCLNKINGQRTIYSVLHLLNGKKSAQTIQDAHLFALKHLFGCFPRLIRADLEKTVCDLQNSRLLQKESDQNFHLTPIGKKELNEFFKEFPIPQALDGWKYNQLAPLFWSRLSLLIQVISQLINHDTRYIPIRKERELQQWVKAYLLETRLNRIELGKGLYNELLDCLKGIKDGDPSILVLRLSGYQKAGLTSSQASETLNMDIHAYHVQFLGMLHYILDVVSAENKKYPLLFRLAAQQNQWMPLTQSATKTFALLKQGFQLEEIVRIRRLKKSTIEDHIVEIAINYDGFDISPFVGEKKQQTIAQAAKTLATKQLKHIRQLVPDAAYFEIRLVLAKEGDQK